MKLNNKSKVLNWLWKDLLYLERKALAATFVLEVIGFSGQVAAYGVLFKYVSALEENATLHFLGEAYVPKLSHTLLLVVAICTGLLFVVSSVFNYWSETRTIDLTRKYEVRCSHRILSALHSSVQLDKKEQIDNKSYDFRNLRRALIKDARFCGKAVPVVSFAMIVGIKFFLSLVFMFSIDFLLTGIILIMIIPMFFVTKYVGRRVVKLTTEREGRLLSFVNAKKNIISSVFQNPELSKEELLSADNEPEIASFYDAYFGVRKKLALNDLVSISFMALLAIVIILTGGKLVLFGNMPWSIFIAYIVALRFFFGSLQGVSLLVKKSSKIYEYVSHYLRFLRELQSRDQSLIAEGIQNESPNNIGLDLDDDDDEDDEL